MRVDLPVADTWYTASERARESLGIADDANVSVQVYLGIRHALWEVSQALASTYPHRRTIGFTPFTGPEGEFVALQFAKDGFTIKSLTQDEFDQPKSWLETASKQMLCLLSSFDDPATGELFQTDSHLAAMKDQRIFRIVLSHSYHKHFALEKVGPFDVQIISINTNLAIVVLGERAKITPPIAANLDWSKLDFKEILNRESPLQKLEQEKSLKEFLNLRVDGFEFYSTKKSIPDRALLFCSDVEGLSLATKLAKKISSNVPAQGESGDVETLSLCRWQDPRSLEWLAIKGLTPEKLRGSILLSAELIARLGPEKMAKAIAESRHELLAEQSS